MISFVLNTHLNFQNKELMSDVQHLRSEKDDLRQENEKLREELRCLRISRTLESPLGSAESSVHPLPQGHSSTLTETPALLLMWMIFYQMTIYLGWQKTVTSHLSKIWSPTSIQNPTLQR